MRPFLLMVLAIGAAACGIVAKPVDLTLGNGDLLRVEAVSPNIFRVRLGADGRFEPSLMERYGIVRTNWPALEATVREQAGITRLSAGALFIKAGAIIPYWPEMDFVGEKPVETIRLEVYPEGKSAFTLYEDDGNSLDYLKGAVAETAMQCEAAKGQVKLSLAPRAGSYQGMPSRRGYDLRIHTANPQSVTINGGKTDWTYEASTGSVCLTATEDATRKTPVVVEVGW